MPDIIRQIHRKDIVLTDQYLSNTPFHAGFWVQKTIGDSIKSNANLARGILLDIGCGVKPYEGVFKPYIEKYIGLEYSPESGYRGNRADFCGDAGRLPLADESVDTILCTEVFEHLPDPEKAAEEIARVLKPGGVVIITAPFIYPVHDSYDFFRYSSKGISTILERYGLKTIKIESLSNGGVTMAAMFNIYWFELGFMWTKWLYPLGILLRPVLWLVMMLINFAGWTADKIISSPQMSFNHLTIAKK